MSWWSVIGFLILLVLGTFVTLYFLKPGLLYSKNEGFQTTLVPTSQVYLVTKSDNTKMTYSDAYQVCNIHGGRLALATEVYNAAVDGANWTIPGWIAEDTTYGYFPIKANRCVEGGVVCGPAIVRHNAETNVNCDGNYSNTDTTYNGAICFGILSGQKEGYTVTLYSDSDSLVTSSTNIDTSNASYLVSSVFDSSTLKTYTVLDINALQVQKNIIQYDMEEKNKIVYDFEKSSMTRLDSRRLSYIINLLDFEQKRYYAGYTIAKKHIELLKSLSNFFDLNPFNSNPFSSIVQAFSIKPDINLNQYKIILLNNINMYYSNIISKLNSHPIGYICSGVINEPVYLNSAGLIDLKTAGTWEYLMDDNAIYKQRPPPYSGCGTTDYKKPHNGTWSIWNHCPAVTWWSDKKTLKSNCNVKSWNAAKCRKGSNKCSWGCYQDNISKGCGPCGKQIWTCDEYGDWDCLGLLVCDDGWYSPGWDPGFCYREWPQLRQNITVRDINLIKIPSAQPNYYPTTFLSSTDSWSPVAFSVAGNRVLTAFKNEKTKLVTEYTVTNIINTYRWKPIKFIGIISDKNKEEAKHSASISAIFNFNGNADVEQQIRISSTSFNLFYSKTANARKEFIQIVNPSARASSSNADLLIALTIIGVATTVLAGSISSVASRGAALSGTAARATQLQKRANWASRAQILGAAISLGGAVGMILNQGSNTGANFKISAGNADYNDVNCIPFDETLFNLLPYNAREFITLWAMMRRIRTIEWYNTSVLNPTANNKNPPEGPYKGSPKSANLTKGVITNDISSNIFNTGNTYTLSECSVLNKIPTKVERDILYDSIAQLYYKENNGIAYMTKIVDLYQVGETLFDVRFTESRRSGITIYSDQIADITNHYKEYRNMNLSLNQLNDLEEKYKSHLDNIYDKQDNDFIDSAKDCGVKAKYMKICGTTSQMIFGQIIAINNYGQNVAYLQQATASSVYIPSYEDATGKTFYDNNYEAYTDTKSAEVAVQVNSGITTKNLSILTDGNYTPRYDTYYKNKLDDLSAWVQIDFGDEYDITTVRVMHNIILADTTFTVELYSKENIKITSADLVCKANTTSEDVSFLKSRPTNSIPCPTNIYSQYKVARFFAKYLPTNPTIPIFTGYAEGIDATTTFNPLYNSGFPYDTTDSAGNTLYKPKTNFNLNTVHSNILPSCTTPARIESVFKDHLLHANNSNFRNKSNIKSLTTPYHADYIYRPVSVTAVAQAPAATNNYNCAYIWKENVYNGEDGAIMKPLDELKDDKSTRLDDKGQITRYGIFKYEYDNTNWVSKGIVYDVSNTVQFNTEDLLKAAIPTGNSLTTLPEPHELYVPYFDSLSLDSNGGACPQTDCSDPDVINSIVSVYNNYPSVSTSKSQILRITKALTPAPNKCEYEFITSLSLLNKLSFNVKLNTTYGECKYIPNNFISPSNSQIYPLITETSYITDYTPLLSKAYNYASDTLASYITRMSAIYSEISTGYIASQIDPVGEGIQSDIYKYRTITATAAGQIRNVSMIDQPVKNEANGSTCITMCNSPEIIQSFFTYYNKAGGDKVKEIQNVGMDASGNCDFTYTTSPIVLTGGIASLGAGTGTTRGAKFQINRLKNSCEYSVTGTPAIIRPIPNLKDVLNFSTISLFPPRNNPSGDISPVSTAEMGIIGPSGQLGPSGQPGSLGKPIKSADAPFTQPTITSQSLTESVDYINCLSKYVLNSISSIGVTGMVTGITNVGAKTCAVNITDSAQSYYSFIPQASVIAVAPILTASVTAGTNITLPVITGLNIASFGSLGCSITLDCNNTATKALTGFSLYIKDGKKVSSDTCEYKISDKVTLPFSNTFQTVSFYTGSLTTPDGTDLHIKSIKNSNPRTSLYRYFKTDNVKDTFISDYMALIQMFRYKWNSNFYSLEPKTTQYWKIGKIEKIGILENEDAIVFEAESSRYGMYGSYDVREHSLKRFFKFTPRINTINGTDPNNYSVQPYTINNIVIYDAVDSATSYGNYKMFSSTVVRSTLDTGSSPSGSSPSGGTLTDSNYTAICTYNGINYNSAWYDLAGTGTKPLNTPPSVYLIQTIEKSLTAGVYNRIRFKVTKSQMTTADARAEIARIMFYDISGYDINNKAIYYYIEIGNANVQIEDIKSTYLLAQRDQRECDTGFTKVMDPELNLAQCIYGQNVSPTYTQTSPCNTGDTFISKTGDLNTCATINMPTYTKIQNVACGIGYFGPISNTTCTLTGNFQPVTQDPSYIFNTNAAIPRLRLPVNKYMTVYFNQTIYISGFSFITGSAGTLPLQWILEGSMNGESESWGKIHCQGTDYNYSGAKPRKTNPGNILITSFFTPGIFLINQTGSSGSNCTTTQTTTVKMVMPDSDPSAFVFDSTGGYSANNVGSYNEITGNITEGFSKGKSPNLPSFYAAPLKQDSIPIIRPVNSQIPEPKRIQFLKFKILGTHDPSSKFVHMSQFEIQTRSGKIPNSVLRLSNLQGSRNSPKEGINSLLENRTRRWVDYNKSDIIIQIIGKTDPIIGFRFSIPDGVKSPMNAMPIEWIMYGSYDNRNWTILHEFNELSLPLINSFATVVFKFDTVLC